MLKKSTIICCVATGACVLLALALTGCGRSGPKDEARAQGNKPDVEACATFLKWPLSHQFGESGGPQRKVTNIRAKLVELGAYCKDGAIYDSRGKKVVFYQIDEGGKENEGTAEHRKWMYQELERLEMDHTVVRMYQVAMPD